MFSSKTFQSISFLLSNDLEMPLLLNTWNNPLKILLLSGAFFARLLMFFIISIGAYLSLRASAAFSIPFPKKLLLKSESLFAEWKMAWRTISAFFHAEDPVYFDNSSLCF